MPRCPTCRDKYGWLSWSETVSEFPCQRCAQQNREERSRREDFAIEQKAEKAEHDRQVQITQLETDAGMRRKEEEEKTKRENHEKDTEAACRRTREEEETKRRKAEQDSEVEKLKFETERKSKMELALEEAKQLQMKQQAEMEKTNLEYLIAQEKTKQVKAEAEERTKQVEAEQRTKQMEAEAKKLSYCASIVTSLAQAGTDKGVIESTLCQMLGAVELMPEKPNKVTIPTTFAQSKFLESLAKEPLKASKRNNFPAPHGVRTAPV